MSDSKTAAIKKFKAAFKVHAEAWRVFSDPEAARTLLKQAVELLDKRITSGTETIQTVNSEPTAQNRKMTAELFKISDDLLKRSTDVIRIAKELPEKTAQTDIDKVTASAQGLIDQWDAFERQCASARNTMKVSIDDNALAEALAKRAKGLLNQANELEVVLKKEATPTREAIQDLLLMIEDKKSKIKDFSDTIKQLDRCQERIIALSLKLPKKNVELCANALQNIYGIEFKLGKGAEKEKVPYQQLLAAFSMVPPEHARNLVLTSLEIKEIPYEGGKLKGGMYSKADKLISITPDVLATELEDYVNPETGKPEAVNSFSITTLHEIGHSVDEAYGLMKANATTVGWTEVDAAGFVQSDFDTNKEAMATSLRSFLATCIPNADKIGFDETELRKSYLSYAAGTPVDDAFKDYLIKLIRGSGILDAVATAMLVKTALEKPAFDIFANAKRGDKVADLWAQLEGVVDKQLEELGKVTLVSLTKGEIHDKFVEPFGKVHTVETDKVDGTEFRIWLTFHPQFDPQIGNQRVEAANADAAKWSSKAKTPPPKPVDLSKFGSRQKPWAKIDLTTEPKIGELPAAHQAYEGDTTWWRYSDKKTSFVTNYQWRAPAEWFAELYAITWFKKVEPPTVPGPLRAYFYGGSVSV